jgi:hypothetical protein
MRLALGVLAVAGFAGPPAAAQGTRPSVVEAARRNAARKVERPPLTLPGLVASLIPRVEKLRGRPFLHEVPMETIDTAGIEARFSGHVEDEETRKLIEIEQRAMVELGVLPEGIDLAERHVATAVEHLSGLYDMKEKRFYVRADLPPSELAETIVHELTHALDDQYFDLMVKRTEAASDDDRGTAFTAVVEGSAMLVTLLYYLEEIEAGRIENPFVRRELKSAAAAAQARKRNREEKKKPSELDAFQKSVFAPYALGLRFLIHGDPHSLLRKSMDGYLDQVFHDPPLTTREILNPGMYFLREDRGRAASDLLVRDLSDVIGEGWERTALGQLGEMNLAILGEVERNKAFDPFNPMSWSGKASAGLVADTWHLYTRGEETVTILTTRWQTVTDAQEFRDLLIPRDGRNTYYSDLMVCLIAGPDKPTATRLAAAALSSATLTH